VKTAGWVATSPPRTAFTSIAWPRGAGPAGVPITPFKSLEFHVHDVLFVLLAVLVFVILAVIAKGAEKL